MLSVTRITDKIKRYTYLQMGKASGRIVHHPDPALWSNGHILFMEPMPAGLVKARGKTGAWRFGLIESEAATHVFESSVNLAKHNATPLHMGVYTPGKKESPIVSFLDETDKTTIYDGRYVSTMIALCHVNAAPDQYVWKVGHGPKHHVLVLFHTNGKMFFPISVLIALNIPNGAIDSIVWEEPTPEPETAIVAMEPTPEAKTAPEPEPIPEPEPEPKAKTKGNGMIDPETGTPYFDNTPNIQEKEKDLDHWSVYDTAFVPALNAALAIETPKKRIGGIMVLKAGLIECPTTNKRTYKANLDFAIERADELDEPDQAFMGEWYTKTTNIVTNADRKRAKRIGLDGGAALLVVCPLMLYLLDVDGKTFAENERVKA